MIALAKDYFKHDHCIYEDSEIYCRVVSANWIFYRPAVEGADKTFGWSMAPSTSYTSFEPQNAVLLRTNKGGTGFFLGMIEITQQMLDCDYIGFTAPFNFEVVLQRWVTRGTDNMQKHRPHQ